MNKIHQMFDLFITTLVVLETWWENTFFYIFIRFSDFLGNMFDKSSSLKSWNHLKREMFPVCHLHFVYFCSKSVSIQMFDLFITTLVVLETWWENTFFYIFIRMILWQSIRWWYSSRIQQNFKWKQIYCKNKQNVNVWHETN
jgi:hypothetical protein